MTAADGRDNVFLRELFSQQAAVAANRITVQRDTYLHCDAAIYFPIDAIASVSFAKSEMAFQLGLAARGDAIGIQSVFDSDCPPLGARVLKAGTLISVCPDLLRRLIKENPRLRDRLSAYAMRSLGHYLNEAVCAATLSIEKRVAHWIHRYREVLGSDSLLVTHQQVASALGVRRSGVTVALHVLEGEHLLRSKRSQIEVLDAPSLLAFAEATAKPLDIPPDHIGRRAEASPAETPVAMA